MHLLDVSLHRVRLPFAEPWVTSATELTSRELTVLHATFDDAQGWGECSALADASYSPEFVDAAAIVLERFAIPQLFAHPGELAAVDVAEVLDDIRGHRMVKAAIEMAVLDAESQVAGISLAERLGGTRAAVDAGVTVGLHDTLEDLVEVVAGHVAAGYRRVKLKIEPGLDVEWVRAVRDEFAGIALQVDANGAYRAEDMLQLVELDDCGLLLIEQPLAEDDLLGHAALGRILETPICLDEALVSLHSTRAALALGACRIVNVKPARVGGLLEAVRIHDYCRDAGVAAWCGGMLESGIGRAALVALASLDGFTLPGDLSASKRFFTRDLVTAPLELTDGRIEVPTGAGLGVEVDRDALDDLSIGAPLVIHRS